MPLKLEKGEYLTAEEYRQKIGFANVNTIYEAIREGRLECVKDGNGRILIPSHAIVRDKRLKANGMYIGLRKWLSQQISTPDELPDIDIKRRGGTGGAGY